MHNNFGKWMEKLDVKMELQILQKACLLGTARILRYQCLASEGTGCILMVSKMGQIPITPAISSKLCTNKIIIIILIITFIES